MLLDDSRFVSIFQLAQSIRIKFEKRCRLFFAIPISYSSYLPLQNLSLLLFLFLLALSAYVSLCYVVYINIRCSKAAIATSGTYIELLAQSIYPFRVL